MAARSLPLKRVRSPWKRVADHLWRADGCPERYALEPNSVGRDWYHARAREVIDGLHALGYAVVRARPPRKTTR